MHAISPSACLVIVSTLLFPVSSVVGMMMTKDLLVVVGLNAALQKRFVIQNHGDLVPGKVHRASEIQTGVGGKGQDVAIALNCLGTKGLRLLQFVGRGAEGDTVDQLLAERIGTDAIRESTVRVKSHMRTCTSIVGASDTTELVEPSGKIEEGEIQELLSICEKLAPVAGICIMGSMPPGCDTELYSKVYRWLSSNKQASGGPICVIDSVAGIEPTFQHLVGPTIFKVNAQELCSLVGLDDGTSLTEAVPAFLKKFNPPKNLEALAITDGKHPAHLCWLKHEGPEPWALFPLKIPKLDSDTLYPIGAGDAVAAGFLASWMVLQSDDTESTTLSPSSQSALRKRVETLHKSGLPAPASTLVAAFTFGLACGSASCLQEQNSVLDGKDVLRLFDDLDTAL